VNQAKVIRMRCLGIVVGVLVWPILAHADAVSSFMEWVGHHFQVKPAITSGVFRGGTQSAGTLWMVAGDGAPRQLNAEHRYSVAVFSGSNIVAVREGQLVQIDPSDGKERGDACETGPKDPPSVIFSGSEPGQIGVVTATGRILEVTFDGKRCSSKLQRRLPADTVAANHIRQTLSDLSRRCGEREVASVPQDGPNGTRDEIVLFVPKQANRVLTSASTLRHHHSPAFSADCQNIIYLATQ
jgi:hypothetical protein